MWPEWEDDEDVVVAVVEILVGGDAEHDDHVEDGDQGGRGAVAPHPGPGHTPPLHWLLHLSVWNLGMH